MSPSAPRPDHAAPIVQELLQWVPKNCINGTNGPSTTLNRPFMPLPDLDAYFKAESRTSRLLRALYSERDHQVIVKTLEDQYIRVFTILTLMGKGTYIEHFMQHTNLRDNRLPFLEKPAHFPIDPSDRAFWESFYEKQFAFCAHHFGYNENYTKLEDLFILPIVSKEALGQGGSAAIYKIKLHPFYDRLNVAADVSKTYPARPANTYVLKTYNTKDAHLYFRNEVDAFKKLDKGGIDQNLIQFLGSYSQGDTYNILLEYADCGTLEDFFRNVTPPSLGEDIVMFWKKLFNVIQALVRVHGTERPDGFGGPDILIGWHQDVKPSNILVLSGRTSHPYDVEFKLADLGLSHFKRTVKSDRSIADSDIGGTKDYGAPECHRSDEFLEQSKLKVKRSIDIWSFGGVCSEAAVWVVLGLSGLNDYRTQRQQEICEKGTLQDGQCFHDGEKVLQTVNSMHHRLLTKGEVRPGDCITIPILDRMVNYMLEEDPEGRFDAIQLWKASQKLLRKAQLELQKSNQQTASRPVDSVIGTTQVLRLNMPETPPKTPHKGPQPYRNSHTIGPPPSYPQYRLTDPSTGRSSVKHTQRRSEPWQEPSVNPDIAPSPGYGSSSPTPTHWSRETSPPLEMYSVFQEQQKICETPSHDTASGYRDNSWQNVHPLRYSPSNGSRDMNPLESPSVLRPKTLSFPPSDAESGARDQFSRQTRRQGDPIPTYFPNSDAVEPPLEPNLERPKFAHDATSYETPHPSNISSNKALQTSPPRTPRIPPLASPISVAPRVQTKKPHLSYETAKHIREKRDNLPSDTQDLLNRLKDRDHVFLMDNSISMKTHWDDVVQLFSVFAWFVKRFDSNGMEMYFTVSEKKKTFKDTSSIVSHLKSMKHTTYSNIDIPLGEILRKYAFELESWKKRQKRPFWKGADIKPLSLYVFTDAAWQGCDAVAPMRAMIEKQRDLEFPKEQVGVQFIRFGNDPNGITKLKYLDSGLREEYTKRWDIVDTEPFQDGNLLKMLLGGIYDWFDADDNGPD